MADPTTLDHQTDPDGNLYILAGANKFDSSSGSPFEGPESRSSIICKTSKGGDLLWEKILESVTANQLFLDDHQNPVLSYGVYSSFFYGALYPIYPNGRLVADTKTGNILKNSTFLDSGLITYKLIGYNFYNDTLMSLYCVPFTYTPHLGIAEKRLASTNELLEHRSIESSWSLDISLAFDEYRHTCVRAPWDKPYLEVYDNEFIKTDSFVFCDTNVSSYNSVGAGKIAINELYYAFIYSVHYKGHPSDSVNVFLCIMDKKGKVISNKISPAYSSLYWDDNTLWGVTTSYGQDNQPINHPIIVDQMDLHQKAIRKLQIGFPYCIGTKVSVYSNRELIVTGTYDLANYAFYPDKKPSQLYVYRQQIRDIPTIEKQSVCDNLSISPNPTDGRLDIHLPPVNGQQNYELLVTNILGQRITATSFASQTATLDISVLPQGMYIVKLVDQSDGAVCASKIVKK